VAVPWRYQARCPYFVTGSCEPTTTVSGLSSRPDCSGPAITRPVRWFHYRTNPIHHPDRVWAGDGAEGPESETTSLVNNNFCKC
jgi:hypothetical protein